MCIVQSTLLYQVYITLVNLNILGVRPDSNPGPQVVSLLSYHYTWYSSVDCTMHINVHAVTSEYN